MIDILPLKQNGYDNKMNWYVTSQTAENIIPICSGCGKVKPTNRHMTGGKAYLTKDEQNAYSAAGYHFSHGICYDCFTRMEGVIPGISRSDFDEWEG